MFFFRKKYNENAFKGYTDYHSHILYGVDDGVKTLDTSLNILKRYEEYGISDVWLTPHIQEYMPNTTTELKERYTELCKAYNGDIRLHLAAEYMIDPLLEERLEANDLLYHGDNDEKRLLVETSYFNPPIAFEDSLRRIMSRGIRPILAHPERYIYMEGKDYARLHDMGVLFQLNLPSLIGLYGKSAMRKANDLLNNNYYNITGTDIHSIELLDSFDKLSGKTYKLWQNLK